MLCLCYIVCFVVFFFFKQKTAYEMRISDWSSDVCSSDLLLQEIFLSAVRKSGSPVTMFLVNGVMLQGEIAAFDLFCMLLERDGMIQLVYKHAISTVQPLHALDLTGEGEGED